MPDDPSALISLLPQGGAVVAVLVCVWIFAKYVSRTQEANDRIIERFMLALDSMKNELSGLRTEVAKLADAVNDFEGRRKTEGG